MITLRYYLDTRRPSKRPDGTYPLMLTVTKRGKVAMMPTLVFLKPDDWDQAAQRTRRALYDTRGINSYLDQLRMKCEDLLRPLILSGEAATMPATAMRDHLVRKTMSAGPGISLREYYDRIAAEKKGATAELFRRAALCFDHFDAKFMGRELAEISKDDIARLDSWLRDHFSPNTRNAYLQKICQVFRRAHEEGLIMANPCRDVQFRRVNTKSRALTVEQLRAFFAYDTKTEMQREFLDFFRLSFYSRAANSVDIARWTPGNVFNGRLQYTRSKTGKDYDIRIEPELQEIIDRRGDGAHLFAAVSAREYYKDYANSCNICLTKMARKIGLPPVTMYWARHTLASLMLEIGVPVELIAAALGHSYGPQVTMGYINIRQRQVDEAVRRVYDYVAGTWSPEK